MYNSRDGTQYDPKKDTLRDMSTVEQIKEGESIYIKHLKGDKCNAVGTSSLKDPINYPFLSTIWCK